MLLSGVALSHFALAAESDLGTPTRLMADGKIIDTGPQWGHSSPCVEDLDGDGLKDLLLGDFSGKFMVYKNVGTPKKAVFKKIGHVKANDKVAEVRIYCCIGSQARFVDLDGDGVRDFISNSYDPGHCYLFRGLPEGKFAARREVLDKAGVPVRSSPKQKQSFRSFGSFYMPVDWDADGDADLLIGCFDGSLKLRLNEGTAKAYAFAADNVPVEAGGKPLKVGAHCCPLVVDWDGDGLWDLLAGADDGSVTFFRNEGKPGYPRFAEGKILIAKHEGTGYDIAYWKDEDIRPGIRSQIEVADLNGDGKLDLLLGDFYSAYQFKPDLTDAQKDEFRAAHKQMADIHRGMRAGIEKLSEDFKKRFPGDAGHSDEASKQWDKDYKAFRESPETKKAEASEADFVRRVRPLLARTRGLGDSTFDLSIAHGHVWVYQRP